MEKSKTSTKYSANAVFDFNYYLDNYFKKIIKSPTTNDLFQKIKTLIKINK